MSNKTLSGKLSVANLTSGTKQYLVFSSTVGNVTNVVV